jgi:hypothetical protein
MEIRRWYEKLTRKCEADAEGVTSADARMSMIALYFLYYMYINIIVELKTSLKLALTRNREAS